MGQSALKNKADSKLEQKRMSLNEKFSNPEEVLVMMSEFLKEGDIASLTDLISAYIKNSHKYSSQEEFATAIGTTRQTLHRMLSHADNVSIKVFFNAVERIYDDANA
jgi:DNA-binding phage protein